MRVSRQKTTVAAAKGRNVSPNCPDGNKSGSRMTVSLMRLDMEVSHAATAACEVSKWGLYGFLRKQGGQSPETKIGTVPETGTEEQPLLTHLSPAHKSARIDIRFERLPLGCGDVDVVRVLCRKVYGRCRT
jgi:hypothetical protein